MTTANRRASLLAVMLLTMGSQLTQANDGTNGWTGFQNGGKLTLNQLPTDWKADGTNIAWQAKLEGYGQSSRLLLVRKFTSPAPAAPTKRNCMWLR